jgi:hypothetical protein
VALLDSVSSFQVISNTQINNRSPFSEKQLLHIIRPQVSSTLASSRVILRSEAPTDSENQASDDDADAAGSTEELSPDELTLITTISQIPDPQQVETFLMSNLPNMPPHVILALRGAAEKEDMPQLKNLSEEESQALESVGKVLVRIMDEQLQSGRDLLKSFLDCGEIRKLDGAIGRAVKDNKMTMSFFTVLNMNLRDAALEQLVNSSDEADPLSPTAEGEFSTGDSANRYQILQHIYTRCQEEVEKVASPGSGLLNKLLRTEQSSIRSNQLSHYLCPQAPKTISSPDGTSVELPGSKALVKPSELIEALKNAIRQIRTVEKTGTVDRAAAVGLVESCRQIAIEARFAIGEGYGVDSEELKEFEVSLQPVFRPDSAESEFIAGVE